MTHGRRGLWRNLLLVGVAAVILVVGMPEEGAAQIAVRDGPATPVVGRTPIRAGGQACAPAARADVRRRFRGLLGVLGCAPSEGLTPPVPGGCLGSWRFVQRSMRRYDQLYRQGGCTGEPPDLTSYVEAYESEYRARNEFVEHDIARGPYVVHAREYGAAHRGRGPTILLMHGFPDDQRLYDLVAPALGETHHTITFDFVDYGHSSAFPDGHSYSFDDLRADLDAVVEYFDAETYVPVVHDISGFPGIDWALDNPDRTTALVILNSAYMATEHARPPFPLRALMDPGFRPVYLSLVPENSLIDRAIFEVQVGSFMTNDVRRLEMLPIFADAHPVAQRSIRGLTETLFETIIDRTSETARMESFPRPVRVVFGEDDPHLNVGIARAFADFFPESTLVLVEEANHYVQIDRPDAVIEQVLAAAGEG